MSSPPEGPLQSFQHFGTALNRLLLWESNLRQDAVVYLWRVITGVSVSNVMFKREESLRVASNAFYNSKFWSFCQPVPTSFRI